MAEDFIVKDVDVSKFSGESRFAGIYFAVNDDTYAQSPTDINEDDILFPFDTPLQILAVCHCAGVIIDTNLITDFFRQYLCQRTFGEIELAEAVSGFGVDTS